MCGCPKHRWAHQCPTLVRSAAPHTTLDKVAVGEEMQVEQDEYDRRFDDHGPATIQTP